MASQPEYQNLYITTTTISTYDHYTGVVVIDTIWTGTYLNHQIFSTIDHQVIYPSPTPSATPRPPSSLVRRLELLRGAPSINAIPDSPVATRQNGLAALVANTAAETGRNQVPFTFGQARDLTPAERSLERVRADLARWREGNRTRRTSVAANSRGRVVLREQLLDGVPEVLQRTANYTYIREGRVIRQVRNSEGGVGRGNNNNTSTTRQVDGDETTTTIPTLTEYSRHRTRAILRRRHGSTDMGESSLLDGEIGELEGYAVLRPSTARGSSGSLDEGEN
ncbi:hypothetical protein KCU65_g7677, partial [Aureobasidium melanogenum]